MDILLINQDWFKEEFEAAGHRVVTCGVRHHLDIEVPHPMLSLDYILNKCPEGFRPERIVIYDESAPLFLVGIEESGIPALFYSVDIQHHHHNHKYIAKNFSKTLVAQKDYLDQFEAVGTQAEWCPLWASKTYEPSKDKKYQAIFVGTMDKDLNPERVAFFDALKEKAPLVCEHGEYWKLFPHAEIVMNQTVKGDLNFRVFEALMSGSVLLTEEAPNGLGDLFQDGVHLVTYRKNDVDHAAEKIQNLLNDKELSSRIGAAGRAEVLAKHTSRARGAHVLEIVEDLEPLDEIEYFYMVPNYDWLYRKLKELDTELAVRTIKYIMVLMTKGLAARQTLNHDLAMYVVYACLEHDIWHRSTEGEMLLERFADTYPGVSVFKMACIWKLLNRGEREQADAAIRALPVDDVQVVYQEINDLMSEILGVNI